MGLGRTWVHASEVSRISCGSRIRALLSPAPALRNSLKILNKLLIGMVWRLGRKRMVEICYICIKQRSCDSFNSNLSCADHPTCPSLQEVSLRE